MRDTTHADSPQSGQLHTTSWSMNLEGPEYETDRDRLVADALDAVVRTAKGRHVNLVTHAAHGHPDTYLTDELVATFGDDVQIEYVDQCGCGGHVTRVTIFESE